MVTSAPAAGRRFRTRSTCRRPTPTVGSIFNSAYRVAAARPTVDDVALYTTYASATVTGDGLPETRVDELGRVTRDAYTASAAHPAIFPTTMTANEVGGGSGSDQNAVTTTTYDAWGRALTVADPDSMTTTTVYAANKTDVASENDGLNTTTYPSYDAIGQRLSVVTPLSETTTTDYDYFGNVTSTLLPAAPNAVTNKSTYDGAGLSHHRYIVNNRVDGTPSLWFIQFIHTMFALTCSGRRHPHARRRWFRGRLHQGQVEHGLRPAGQPDQPDHLRRHRGKRRPHGHHLLRRRGQCDRQQGPDRPDGHERSGLPGRGRPHEVRTLDFNGQVIATTDAYGKKTRRCTTSPVDRSRSSPIRWVVAAHPTRT